MNNRENQIMAKLVNALIKSKSILGIKKASSIACQWGIPIDVSLRVLVQEKFRVIE